jgi:hypothetical protein
MKTNLYDGKCGSCGNHVPARAGVCYLSAGRWIVQHSTKADCDTAVAANPPKARTAPVDRFPEVVAGYYATPSATGNNDLDFWRVVRPTKGKWVGYVFANRIVGGQGPIRLRRQESEAAIERIAAEGVDKARVLYGQKLGQCGNCNKSLTDEVSRAYGIGPECRKKLGIAA